MDKDVDVKEETAEAGQESLFEEAKRNLTVLELDSDWIKLLKWIQKGTSRDEKKPRLQCILVNRDRIESTDGFSILRAKFNDPDRQLIPEGMWRIQNIFKHLVILERVEGISYPDTVSIYPLTDPISRNAFYAFEILDPKAAKVAITIAFDPEKIKKISYPGHNFQLYLGLGVPTFDFGSIEAEFGKVDISAVLMPMHCSDDARAVAKIGSGLRFVK